MAKLKDLIFQYSNLCNQCLNVGALILHVIWCFYLCVYTSLLDFKFLFFYCVCDSACGMFVCILDTSLFVSILCFFGDYSLFYIIKWVACIIDSITLHCNMAQQNAWKHDPWQLIISVLTMLLLIYSMLFSWLCVILRQLVPGSVDVNYLFFVCFKFEPTEVRRFKTHQNRWSLTNFGCNSVHINLHLEIFNNY